MRTADATSPVLATSIASTLALFILVYGIVFGAGAYYINRLIHRGPDAMLVRPGDMAKGPLGADHVF
jgi:cytochrome d ubiquinol oxidase subunit I